MSGVRILLVEDEWLIRMAVAEALEDEGYEVVQAGTGDAAYDVLAKSAPNWFAVLLTDVHLPGSRDGLRLAEEARVIRPGLRVVYVTGRPEAMTRARLGPHDAFLPKPYGPAELLRVLRWVLGTDGSGPARPT